MRIFLLVQTEQKCDGDVWNDITNAIASLLVQVLVNYHREFQNAKEIGRKFL